jgi:hypothetical protein
MVPMRVFKTWRLSMNQDVTLRHRTLALTLNPSPPGRGRHDSAVLGSLERVRFPRRQSVLMTPAESNSLLARDARVT